MFAGLNSGSILKVSAALLTLVNKVWLQAHPSISFTLQSAWKYRQDDLIPYKIRHEVMMCVFYEEELLTMESLTQIFNQRADEVETCEPTQRASFLCFRQYQTQAMQFT